MDRKKVAVRVVSSIGEFLKNAFGKRNKVNKKKDGSLVSDVDHKSEEIFIKEIRTHFPKDGILSEECGEVAGESDYRWIVDPLDGTHNFLAGLPIFGCFVALEKKGEVIFSVCFFPVLDELFIAEKGKGAELNGARVSVSKHRTLKGAIVIIDGKVQQDLKTLDDMKNFSGVGSRIRSFGSSPFAMTRVALGQAVVATSRCMKPWDLAPVALLVEEAGGKVTDSMGRKWLLSSNLTIATNGFIHTEALKNFKN